MVTARLNTRKGRLYSLFLGFGIGGAFILIYECFRFSILGLPGLGILAYLACNLLIYACLSYNYFHFINLGETARRIRIIREIHESPNGLTKEEILQRYNAKEILELRMGRLLSKGQVSLENDRYHINNPTMLAISNIIIFLKKKLLGKESEFE